MKDLWSFLFIDLKVRFGMEKIKKSFVRIFWESEFQ